MPRNSPQDNPASALPKIWIVEFVTMHDYIPYFLEALEHTADGIRSYEKIEDSGEWHIALHFNSHPDMGQIKSAVTELAAAIAIETPKLDLSEAENKNWVEEIAKQFKAIEASRFYIYSQFSEPSNRLIDIKINPGMAFGTGQHETTYLCLEAIAHLQDEGQSFNKILDLGTGSGILAIAADKIWPDSQITATDNDEIAVRVALENAEINHTDLDAFVSDGFKQIGNTAYPELVSGSPRRAPETSSGSAEIEKFDLILANILMNPLLEMAEDLARHCKDKAVLSGFKTDQVEKIMEKYTSLGFKSERLFVKNHWVALLLTK